MELKTKIEQTMKNFTDTKLQVPYHSQYLEINSTENSLKSCGITCVYMMLDYYEINTLSLDEMVVKGISDGGFGPSGWKHDYFVDLLINMGFESKRMENMKDSDVNIVVESISNGFPVIISAERILFDKRIFHQVLLVGTRKDDKGNLEGFYYHDPASLQIETGEYCYVPIHTFFLSWRRMAIFAKKEL